MAGEDMPASDFRGKPPQLTFRSFVTEHFDAAERKKRATSDLISQSTSAATSGPRFDARPGDVTLTHFHEKPSELSFQTWKHFG
jgi:hypothetical protein